MTGTPADRVPKAAADGQKLCLACGLCCTGAWFSHVNLQPGEEEPARLAGMRVEIVDGNARSHQPCPLHQSGQCTGYESWRPSACATFQCKLLRDYVEGELDMEAALGHVTAARTMAERIRAELGDFEGGLLGPRFLTRIDDDAPAADLGQLTSSPATRLDAVALNLYYTKYFKKPAPSGS